MTNKYFQRTVNKEKAEDDKGVLNIKKIIQSNKYDEYYHKFDGTHLDLYIYQDEPIQLLTRDGNDVAHLVPYLIQRLEEKFSYEGVFACEGVHLERVVNDPRDSWSASRRVLGCKDYNPNEPEINLVIYDVYEHNKEDVTNKSYIERKVFHMPKSLGTHGVKPYVIDCQGIEGIYIPLSFPIKCLDTDWEHHVVQHKREGFVLVNNQKHVDFKRTFTKLKPLLDIDAVVIKYNEGKAGTRLEGKIGSFEVGVYKNIDCPECQGQGCPYCLGYGYLPELVSIGKVPTMNDEERKLWTRRMLNNDLGSRVEGGKVEPYVIQVKASEVTSKGKLRFPSYVRERTDKKPEECTWEQLI